MNSETTNQNLMAAIAYVLGPISGFIFLLVERKNKFVRFHAMQSLITFGLLWALAVVFSYSPILALFSSLLSLATLLLAIFLIVMALQGKMYKLPYIGGIAAKQVGV